jgi:Protein of unknown function (DUF1579)
VGDGETEVECRIEPGKPPMKAKGTESVRSICGLWIVTGKNLRVRDSNPSWRRQARREQEKPIKMPKRRLTTFDETE